MPWTAGDKLAVCGVDAVPGVDVVNLQPRRRRDRTAPAECIEMRTPVAVALEDAGALNAPGTR
jgi:hypothetical protein